jgi:opine dehydrogenase
MALLGQQYGVETNTIHAIVSLSTIIHNGQDHWRQGRTLERMGIKGLTVAELHRYVETGVR